MQSWTPHGKENAQMRVGLLGRKSPRDSRVLSTELRREAGCGMRALALPARVNALSSFLFS